MKKIPIVRCWKNLDNNHLVLIALLLNKFKNKFNFSFQITITHRLDEEVVKSIENYIKDFNLSNNSNHEFTVIPLESLDNFLIETFNISKETIDKIKNQPVLYNIVLGFYVRYVVNFDYVLFHDDDILYNRHPINLVDSLLYEEKPFSLHHPYTFSDFSLVGKLTLLLGKDVYTPYSTKGMSASSTSFMGINLSVLDIFSKQDVYTLFTDILKYDSYGDTIDNPHFQDGMFSFNLYSQEQSFFSLLVRARNSEFIILPTDQGYATYLSHEEIESNNPLIHHYMYNLKFNGYHKTFLDYYNSRLVSGLDLFAQY